MPQPMAMGWRGYLVGARRLQFLDPVLHTMRLRPSPEPCRVLFLTLRDV